MPQPKVHQVASPDLPGYLFSELEQLPQPFAAAYNDPSNQSNKLINGGTTAQLGGGGPFLATWLFKPTGDMFWGESLGATQGYVR